MTFEEIMRLSKEERKSKYTAGDIDKVIIDGNEITAYMSYSYIDKKTYAKQPYRSLGGVIGNLNSYNTFLTPKCKIKFSIISIDEYRTIMKLIQQKNEFTVKAYDIVWDKIVTKKMYFYPQDYPTLYNVGYEVLGVLDYEIELVGTNADLDLVSVVYHLNPPSDTGQSDQTYANEDVAQGTEILIGDGCTFQEETFNNSYVFQDWNVEIDGSGFIYKDNQAYKVNNSLVLYAQWRTSNTYTLSYNYGLGEIDEDNISKEIVYGNTIGALPTTSSQTVTYNNVEYTPYEFVGWYWTPQIGYHSQKITSDTLYEVKGNATIYQIFRAKKYGIVFESNGGTIFGNAQQEYGSTLYLPTPVRSGYTFVGWFTDSSLSEDSEFTDTTMPPFNLRLYAKWEIEE